MNKSKIDWCDFTWNPITGCHHTCEYCYARKMANRFGGDTTENLKSDQIQAISHNECALYTLQQPFKDKDGRTVSFPADFEPTLHKYRLQLPAQKKKPENIFVCSMADLFGEWVPDEWIRRVFEACEAAPWHNYLFLTKNPQRLCDIGNAGWLPNHDNWWYGTSVTKSGDQMFNGRISDNIFLSIEPLLGSLNTGAACFNRARWIIVGAETGNRRGKVTPKREWIENIIEAARLNHAYVLLKDSKEMRAVWGDDLIQEIPIGLRKIEREPAPND